MGLVGTLWGLSRPYNTPFRLPPPPPPRASTIADISSLWNHPWLIIGGPVPFVHATFIHATSVHATSINATSVHASLSMQHLSRRNICHVYICSLSRVLIILAVMFQFGPNNEISNQLQSKCYCSAWAQAKTKSLSFGPKQNTKVSFNTHHPPPTTHHHRKLFRGFYTW